MAFAILQITRVMDVCVRTFGTCAMDCMVVGVRSIAAITQTVGDASFWCSSGVVTGVVLHFTSHDVLLLL
jgi:hypothetical protein